MRRRFRVEWLLMMALLPPALWWLQRSPGLAQIDLAAYDHVMSRARATPSPDILVVGIDQRSINALGPWPWPRSVHARLLERLAPMEPKGVLLDLFLDMPSEDPEEDRLLAQAMTRVPVYLPLSYTGQLDGALDDTPGFREPLPEFARRAKALGHVNITRDADGVARRMFLREGLRGHLHDYLGWILASGHPASDVVIAPSRQRADGWQMQGEFGIPLAGPVGSWRTVPFVSVLRGDVPSELLRHKVILIGAVGSSRLEDELPVTGAGAMTSLPSIELHANAIDALRQGTTVRFADGAWLAAWIAVPIWLALALFRRFARKAWTVALALITVCVGFSLGMFAAAHLWLPPSAPVLGIVVGYMLWSWRRLDALFRFFDQRAAALNAVPSGAFDPERRAPVQAWDDVHAHALMLDDAIDRVGQIRTLLSTSLWQMPVALLVCRGDGTITTSNAAARALLSAQAAGSDEADDPLRGRAVVDMLADTRCDGLTDPLGAGAKEWAEGIDVERTTLDGKVLRVRAATLHQQDSVSTRWLVVLHDLTAERRAEQEREQWLSFMSHDMRTPQVNILSLLDLRAHGADWLEQPLLTESLRREAERSLRLADDFVDLLKARMHSYRFVEMPAGAIALDAVDQVWAHAAQRGVKLSAEVPTEEDVELWTDAPLLTRAVVNLLNNAIRYSPSGASIRLCVSAGGEAAPHRVLIAVSDEGAGMSPEVMEALLHQDTEGVMPALDGDMDATASSGFAARSHGVGLAIVRAVVDRHGGRLDGHSAPGVGTTFVMDLPRHFPADRT
ncbi:CHASE2 domain-containing protein [Variovorax sp. AFSI2.2]|uniref:CHASE2 domain-containing protein n=1 Tax=Variovorax sp. AFSI2.2 TaxID=3384160 RepID=UPI003EC0CE0C